MTRRIAVATVVASLAVTAVAGAITTAGSPLLVGPSFHTRQLAFRGFYDGHKDVYLITDVSSKSQAAALHVNYSAALSSVRGAPAQYFVTGRAAAGQLTVFGSEPGEPDYNPLWDEVWVTWRRGVKPVLLGRDDQIKSLAKEGKLTITDAHVVLNAPILKTGKGK
jgi:hypothetical protein